MDLIIKPTERCNFKCTFCSSTKIAEHKSDVLDHDYIYKFLKRFPETKTIIVNGGDPLMMEPNYYWKIIDHLEEHNYEATLSNLKNGKNYLIIKELVLQHLFSMVVVD